MSGGNFYISVKQVLESERKIRLVSILKHSGVPIDSITTASDIDQSVSETLATFDIDDVSDFELLDSEIQVVFYISGYCAKSVSSRMKCHQCVSLLISQSTSVPLIEDPVLFLAR